MLISPDKMLSYFKINSEGDLKWDDDPEGGVFVIIIATTQHEFGISNYVCTNTKHQRDVTSRYRTDGCSTVKVLSQFDVKVETSVSSLQEGMRIVGLGALSKYLDIKRTTPFQNADLRRVLEDAITNASAREPDIQDTQEYEECASLTP